MAENKDFDAPGRTGNKPRAQSGKNADNLSNYVFGKVQPQAIPLEEAVLGALMLDREALPVVMDILRPDSFYLESHQVIYRAAMKLFERSNPVDILTVTEELRKSGDLEKAGGAYYLVELSNRIASAANIEYHARIIAQKHIQRELIRVSTLTIRDAYEDTTDVFNLLDEAEKGLFAITQNNLSRSFESMGNLSSRVLKQIEELSRKADGLTGVPTGFTDLDRLTSGWQPSDLVILAARPGMGKCLGRGTRVLLFNGQLKAVEDIQIGDLLMGDDSQPRKVLSLARGREKMYWVRQETGVDYRVNESHILCLKQNRPENPQQTGEILEITVRELRAQTPAFRAQCKGYKVAVEFPEQPAALPPYFFGLQLGAALRPAALKSIPQPAAAGVACAEWVGSPAGLSDDSLQEAADCAAEILPQACLVNSRARRLELLAGLLDACGRLSESSAGFEIANLPEPTARQIKLLCDSLGFRTRLLPGAFGWTIGLAGELREIPLKIHPVPEIACASDWRQTAIRLEYDGVDDYFGFEIDGNGRFLLEDMTVTHNTAFVLAMALNAAKDFQKPVALFSLEMANTQLVQRLISMESEIAGSKMRNGKLEDYEWQQLQTTVERLSNVPIFIDDTPGINIFELRAKCRRLKMQHDIQLVIIDYLQLMTGVTENNRGGNREQEIAGISRALKNMAKELSVPVIALSQLSRAVESRGGTKRPQLSDLRECVTGDTLVTLADGSTIPVRALVGSQPVVQAYDTARSLFCAATAEIVWETGIKQVFEVRLEGGRSVQATAGHRFLGPQGWQTVEALRAGELLALAPDAAGTPENALVWAAILDIRPLGEAPVYDLTVPGPHSWIANGIVSHNSGAIEQDADIVSFIYRPEYYQIMEDENGQSLKGIAEIIIAKHRHGALDTIRVKFTEQFAKFGNLDDPMFGGLDEPFGNPFVSGGGGGGLTISSRMNAEEETPF
ncbi:MAG: replicative DNA helicase [Saprospiraceae bacterium]